MKKIFSFLFLFFASIFSYSQNVGIGTTTPDSSAALEIKSNSQGFLPPRMTTTQRNAIANPAEGLQIFNTTTKCLQIYAYGYWQNIYCAQSTEQPSTLTNGLVAYYPFNGNANDESGNGNNGVVVGATLTTDRFGNANKAYNFNGLSTKIDIGSIANTLIFSISAFVSLNEMKRYNTIIYKGGSAIKNFEFRLDSAYLSASIGNGTTWLEAWNLTDIALNNWNNVTYTYDGYSIRLFFNGILIREFNATGYLFDNSNVYIGSRDVFSWPDLQFTFNGKLDDIRIYNRALTQEEITYMATH